MVVKIYEKKLIDSKLFIKVTNLNKEGQIINLNYYKKLSHCDLGFFYKKVILTMESMNIVEDIIHGVYSTLSKEEIDEFLQKLDETFNYVYKKNEFNKKIPIKLNKECDILYQIDDAKKNKYYLLKSLYINDTCQLNKINGFNMLEIPYILLDMFKDYDIIGVPIFVNIDICVMVEKHDDKYLCMLYHLATPNESFIDIAPIGFFTIINKNNKLSIIIDNTNNNSIQLNNNEIDIKYKRFVGMFNKTISLFKYLVLKRIDDCEIKFNYNL